MNIQTRKIEFIQAFLQLQSEESISRLEELLEIENKEFRPMSIEELNSRIDRSEDDFKNNRFKTTEEILAKYQILKYTVIWSEYSEELIDAIFDYYEKKTKSYDIAKNVIEKILFAPNILLNNPKLGQREILLEDRSIEYRYIVISNYKLIYYVDEFLKTINIVDVFDTRQNPIKLRRN